MKKYSLSIDDYALFISAPNIEAAILRFIEYFGLSYCPEKIKIRGQKNPFIEYPFSERPAREILEMMTDAAECEVLE